MIAGRCLRGAARFEIGAVAGEPVACRRSQGRRRSGRLRASVPAPARSLRTEGEPRWPEASPAARRGIEPLRGGVLVRQGRGEDAVPVATAALDAPTGPRLGARIGVADKGDHDGLGDRLPQWPEARGEP